MTSCKALATMRHRHFDRQQSRVLRSETTGLPRQDGGMLGVAKAAWGEGERTYS